VATDELTATEAEVDVVANEELTAIEDVRAKLAVVAVLAKDDVLAKDADSTVIEAVCEFNTTDEVKLLNDDVVTNEPLSIENPDVPEEPDVPLVPDVPELPDVPLVPLVPEVPEVPCGNCATINKIFSPPVKLCPPPI
jgi:hypothetical protein